MPELKIDAKNKSEFKNIITAMHNNDLKFNQLKFSDCTAEDIISIADALKVNTEVTELDLSHNNIDVEGAKAIAEALKVNTAVTKLNLSWNSIGVEDAKAIAAALKVNTAVTELNLSHNYIKVEGAKAIADALKVNTAVTELDLSHNNIGVEGAKAIADALKVNTAVTKLNLEVNCIYDEGAKAIADALKVNTAVTELNLRHIYLHVEGAKAIADALKVNTAVTELDLGNNGIGVEGAKEIAEALKVNTAVTELDLESNDIGAQGAKAIADALKVNTAVTELNLSRNYIGVEGAKAIADVLKVNTAVTELDLGNNEIGDEGAKAIADALKVNTAVTELDLKHNGIGVEGAKAISDALKVNTAVTKLGLERNGIGVEGAKAIADVLKVNTAVTELDLNLNLIGDEGAKAIADALKVNTAVTELDLGNNEIGVEGAKAMADALKVNKAVTKLNLWANLLIGDEGAKAIADALKVNTAVTKLDLGNNGIGVEGAKEIAEALKVNTAVTKLDLRCNQIGAKGAKAIADALKVNTAVTKLNLRYNQIGVKGAKTIAEALKVNTAVIEFDLGNNWIDAEGAKIIAEALERNQNYLKSTKNEFLAKKELTSQQYQVLLAHMDGYDPLHREKLVGSFLSKAMAYPEAVNTEIGKFISRAELIKFQIPTQLKSIDQIAGPLIEILKLPNNFIFIQDELKNNRPAAELIDNLLIIKNNPNALEFVNNNPKTLGALMRLDKNNLDKVLPGIEFLHAMKPLQILKSSEAILDNNSAKTEFANPFVAAPTELAMDSYTTEGSSSNPTSHKRSHGSEEDDSISKLPRTEESQDVTEGCSIAISLGHFSSESHLLQADSFSSHRLPTLKALDFIMPKLTIEWISSPAKSNAQVMLIKEVETKQSNEASYASYSDALMGLKVLDASVDVFKLIQEPTLEHLNLLARDAAHIGIMFGTSGYLPLVNAVDIAVQFYNGNHSQAFNQIGVTAGYMLLPTMLGTSLAPIYAASVLGYTGYKVADNIYSVYLNYGTAESEIKSNLAYATLYHNLDWQEKEMKSLDNAYKIVEVYNSGESIQQIANEYNLLGKFCELSIMDLF